MRTIDVLDGYAGEGGMGVGLVRGLTRAGFRVRLTAVDNKPARLAAYPAEHTRVQADMLEYLAEHGHRYDFIHISPTCTGYSRGTAAIPDRAQRYDRHIAVARDLVLAAGVPYTLENVADARPELRSPLMLCGRMFGLSAVDDDGTKLTVDRHRLFESNLPLMAPEHTPHGWKSNRRDGIQVAGAYGGARRDKREAREVRRGGYVPASVDVIRTMLGVPWMSEKGAMLCVPPVYGEYLGEQIGALL